MKIQFYASNWYSFHQPLAYQKLIWNHHQFHDKEWVLGLLCTWPTPSMCLSCVPVFESLWMIFQFTQWCRLIFLHYLFPLLSTASLQDITSKVISCRLAVEMSFASYDVTILTVVMRSSNQSVSCLIVFCTVSFVILRIVLYHLIFNAWFVILLLMSKIHRCTERLRMPMTEKAWSLT